MVFNSSRHTPQYKLYISILCTIWCSYPAATRHSTRYIYIMYYMVFNSSRHTPQYKLYISILCTIWCSNPAATRHSTRYIYIMYYMVFNSSRHTPQYKLYIYIMYSISYISIYIGKSPQLGDNCLGFQMPTGLCGDPLCKL